MDAPPTLKNMVSAATHAMRHRTGVVIPVYFPEEIRDASSSELLRETVASFCDQTGVQAVTTPSNNIVVCVKLSGVLTTTLFPALKLFS